MKELDLTAQLKLAQEIATEAHKGQTRRDGSPYLNHPKRVVESLRQSGAGCLALIVAWLHDVVEDCPDWTLGRLLDAGICFDAVAAINLLSKHEGAVYIEYLEQIKANKIALKVKIADIVDNLTDDPTDAQKKKYLNGLLFLSIQDS